MERFVGKNILVLSQTSHYWLGKCVSVDATHLYLEQAAWVADVGRHHAVLASGKPDQHTEIEPHPDCSTMAAPLATSVVIEWPHPLLRSVQ